MRICGTPKSEHKGQGRGGPASERARLVESGKGTRRDVEGGESKGLAWTGVTGSYGCGEVDLPGPALLDSKVADCLGLLDLVALG